MTCRRRENGFTRTLLLKNTVEDRLIRSSFLVTLLEEPISPQIYMQRVSQDERYPALFYKNLNAHLTGDGKRMPKQAVFPPVAGVIYLSTPFWFDRTRPVRQRVIRQYFGSDAEEVWGVSGFH